MNKVFLAAVALSIVGLSCRNTATYPIDKPSEQTLDDRLIGRWKFEEDTNRNNFYEVIRRKPYDLTAYHVKFWNRGGTNPTYESNMHISLINGARFINVPYWEGGFENRGYFFLKILEASTDSTMTTATVADTTMRLLNSSKEVYQRIAGNLNNPHFYSDTVHFFKIKK